MSDLKRECPGCHSHTSAVGQAIEDREPCPYCGYDLSAELTRVERELAWTRDATLKEAEEAVRKLPLSPLGEDLVVAAIWALRSGTEGSES